MADNINMTADEFFDHWSEWCSMNVTVETADVLNEVFKNILTTFEERGSVTHGRGIFGRDAKISYESPDRRRAN